MHDELGALKCPTNIPRATEVASFPFTVMPTIHSFKHSLYDELENQIKGGETDLQLGYIWVTIVHSCCSKLLHIVKRYMRKLLFCHNLVHESFLTYYTSRELRSTWHAVCLSFIRNLLDDPATAYK